MLCLFSILCGFCWLYFFFYFWSKLLYQAAGLLLNTKPPKNYTLKSEGKLFLFHDDSFVERNLDKWQVLECSFDLGQAQLAVSLGSLASLAWNKVHKRSFKENEALYWTEWLTGHPPVWVQAGTDLRSWWVCPKCLWEDIRGSLQGVLLSYQSFRPCSHFTDFRGQTWNFWLCFRYFTLTFDGSFLGKSCQGGRGSFLVLQRTTF